MLGYKTLTQAKTNQSLDGSGRIIGGQKRKKKSGGGQRWCAAGREI